MMEESLHPSTRVRCPVCGVFYAAMWFNDHFDACLIATQTYDISHEHAPMPREDERGVSREETDANASSSSLRYDDANEKDDDENDENEDKDEGERVLLVPIVGRGLTEESPPLASTSYERGGGGENCAGNGVTRSRRGSEVKRSGENGRGTVHVCRVCVEREGAFTHDSNARA